MGRKSGKDERCIGMDYPLIAAMPRALASRFLSNSFAGVLHSDLPRQAGGRVVQAGYFALSPATCLRYQSDYR